MQVRELIRLLNALPEHEKNMGVVFEDKKYGAHVVGHVWVRQTPGIVVLVSRDNPPKEYANAQEEAWKFDQNPHQEETVHRSGTEGSDREDHREEVSRLSDYK